MKNLKKIGLGLFATLTFMFGAALVSPQTALGATPFDKATFSKNGNGKINAKLSGGAVVPFVDSNPSDTIYNYKVDANLNEAFAGIYFCSNSRTSSSNKTKGITLDGKDSNNFSINVDYSAGDCTNPQNYTSKLSFASSGSGGAVTNCDPATNSACKCSSQGCIISGTASTTPPVATPKDPPVEDACGGSGWALSWLACPMLEAAASLATALMDLFLGQLSFTISDLSSNGGQQSLKTAWTIFKNIASALFVIVMLAIVLSEAMNFGPFDAYTIRKMLPRLIIAIILMQVSWALIVYAVNFVNDVGVGLADLMYLPFGGSKAMTFDALLANAGVGDVAASSVGWGGILVGIGVAAFAPFAVLIGAFTAIVSLLVGIATLIFRKILIMMALVFAPVALAAWILPGTKKYFDMWYSNLSKALMMFPLAVALIAAGRIFAYVSGTQTSALFGFFIVLVGFFGPLFLLPKSYKWGGALMTSAGGAIHGAANKLSETPKGYLNRRKESLQLQRQQEAGRRIARGKEKWYYGDQFKSGKWDPLLGKRNSRRRLRHKFGYVAKGVGAEHEDIKAAGEMMQLRIQRLHPDDKDEYVRQIALGQRMKLNEQGQIDWIRGQKGQDGIDMDGMRLNAKGKKYLALDDDGIQLDEKGDKLFNKEDKIVTPLEHRAALDKLVQLGGAGNFRAVEQAHTAALRSGNADRIEEINEFENDNVGTLLAKLPHLFKTVSGTAPSQPGNIVQMHGVEVESMVAQMTNAIARHRAIENDESKTPAERVAAKGKADKSQKSLSTFLDNYAQAVENPNFSGSLDTIGTSTIKALVSGDAKAIASINTARANLGLETIELGGLQVEDTETIRRLNDGIDDRGVVRSPGATMRNRTDTEAATPVAQPQSDGQSGDVHNVSDQILGQTTNQGQTGNIHGAPVGTGLEVKLDHEALGQTLTQSFREAIRTTHAEGISVPGIHPTEESPGTIHLPHGEEHTVPPPAQAPAPPHISTPGDADFHTPSSSNLPRG